MSRLNVWVRIVVILMCGWSATVAAKSPTVLFINPGYEGESFWHDVDLFMTAAASQLDLSLDIYHADRNHLAMIQKAADLAKATQKPDYLVLVNEKQALNKMLESLRGSGIYVFVILNDLPPDKKQALLQDPYWAKYFLGSMIPDNHFIGHETAREMVENHPQASADTASMLIISGDKSTPASQQREAGALAYLATNSSVQLTQVVYGHWSEERAFQQMSSLLRRYPDLKYIWTANDHMAFGAIAAVKERGRVPGQDIFFSTVNTSEKVLRARQDGVISSLGGGHFAAGGWAMVVLYDHLNGIKIPDVKRARLFELIGPEGDAMDRLLLKSWDSIGFKDFSLHSDPSVTEYRFGFR